MPKYHGLDSMQRKSSNSFLLLIFWFWAEQDRESSFLSQCNFVSGMDHFEVLDAFIRSHNEDFKQKFSPWACGRLRRWRRRPPSAGLQTEQLSPDKNISRLFLNIFKISVFLLWIFAWRSKVQVGQNITILDFFIYLYQARVDLLQTSCGPGLGQVWAWLSILLWNWLLIKRLSNIN